MTVTTFLPDGITPTEAFSCDPGNRSWLWVHGHVDRSKFRGRCLSRATARDFEADWDVGDILRGRIVHGWVITVAGDDSGCGWDTTTYFRRHEPVVVDGRWRYDDDGGLPGDAAALFDVVDGPHAATWLEVA